MRDEYLKFPGFCELHEKDFRSFEQGAKGFTSWDEETLQALRSTAREHWAAKDDEAWLRTCHNSYLKMIQAAGLSPAERARWASRIGAPMSEIVRRAGDKATALMQLLDALEKALTEDRQPTFVVTKVFEGTPVIALSGSTRLGTFTNSDGKVDPIYVLLTAVPEVGGTRVIVCATRSDVVKYYENAFLNNADLTRLLRAWMEATDFWFATPSWWACQPREDRGALLRGLATP